MSQSVKECLRVLKSAQYYSRLKSAQGFGTQKVSEDTELMSAQGLEVSKSAQEYPKVNKSTQECPGLQKA